jgi:ribosomal protein S18 acetylase RimI-like enzyme
MGVGEASILSGMGPCESSFLTNVQECEQSRLPPSEAAATLALLSEAFADAPLTRRVVGGSRARRIRSTRLGLAAQLPEAFVRTTVLGARTGATLAGVLIGAPPYAHPFPPPSLARRIWTAAGQGFAVAGRWAELFETLQRHRPERPHWYLALLGVAPAAQRRGVGTALLRGWLAEVDAARGAVWLETDEPRSLGLYRAAGFEIAGATSFASVPIWLLERAPRRA